MKAPHYLSGQLKVGYLIFAHGHRIGLVEDDVGRHKYGIAHQSVVDVLRLHSSLLFEGGHANEPAVGGYHAEQGVENHYLWHVGLNEEDALLGIQASR